MSVFDHPDFDDHQHVVFCHDKSVGLRAIIAIHNTNLGPALGGCRMWAYENDADAITDVLRLSKGMTYKAAMAGLSLGGGKAVIIGDPDRSLRACRAVKHPRVTLHVLPGVYHAFDVKRFRNLRLDVRGNKMMYSAWATVAAERIVKSFFAEHLER